MTAHVSTETLVDYLAGDGDADALEEHLFECDACAAAADELAATADGVALALAHGKARVRATAALLARLEHDGTQLRHYHVAPGGRVDCRVAADDRFVVAHYGADFSGVERVDVLVTDAGGAVLARMVDVPVGPEARALPVLIRGDVLRRMPSGDHHVLLSAGDRVVAEYVFAHEADG
jgi:hypothetical protein